MKTSQFLRRISRVWLLFLLGIAGLNGNAVWAAPTIELLRVPNAGIEPQVVVSGKTVHLIYFSGTDKAGDIFYVRSEDEGRSWSAPLRVNSQAGSAIAVGAIRGGHLAVGRQGRVFVVWNGSDEALPRNEAAPASARQYGDSPFLFVRLNDAGTAFEPQRNLMTRTFELDGGGSVAADDAGTVYAAWHATDQEGGDESKRQVFLAVSRDDGLTFTPEKPVWKEPTGVCGCCQLRLNASAGQIGLLYRSATEMTQRDTYFLSSADGGRTFTGSKVHPWTINSCPMSSYALEQEGGQVRAAWESARQVYFASLSAQGTPRQIIAAPGRGPNRKYPALVTNAAEQTLLLWTEGTAWNRGGTLHGQLFDVQGQPLTALDTSPATPTWSFPATFARADGSFVVLY